MSDDRESVPDQSTRLAEQVATQHRKLGALLAKSDQVVQCANEIVRRARESIQRSKTKGRGVYRSVDAPLRAGPLYAGAIAPVSRC